MSIFLDRPCASLLVLFVSWKALLLLLAVFSPGPAYDTSTTLLELVRTTSETAHDGPVRVILGLISDKLTRWDAIYFTEVARRGYVFEQEWAFSFGFTSLIKAFADALRRATDVNLSFLEDVTGITIAHAAHGMSVLMLYSIARAMFPGIQGRKLAFISACLHIFSPAGLFLSAPYGESTHALLSFTGSLFFVQSFSRSGTSTGLQDALIPLSGVMYGLATAVRSNGLLNGMLFFEEAIRLLYSMTRGVTFATTRRLIAIGVAGVCTGLGFVTPQYIAYRQFCMDELESRKWCHDTPPSIYSFVQDHYWDNGFLRYWTLSNVPLFALAGPMLAIMTYSAIWTLGVDSKVLKPGSVQDSSKAQVHAQAQLTARLLRSLAAPQVTLAILTLLKHHVQIITRMSSGYPVWYLWIAYVLVEGQSLASSGKAVEYLDKKGTSMLNQYRYARVTVGYMIGYATIQGALFASFLPPA
ncbi:ER membrane glycoprotein subunit of the GPI transamidase complex-like protein [Aspergillus hancockii]|nr:ER membrane glycoprotein subunit of the GPI transamidase complex-like protein [Aspergillus hancockii]